MKKLYVRNLLICINFLSFTPLMSQNIEWALENTERGNDFHYGYAIFYKNKKMGAINRMGQVCVPPIFDMLKPFNEYGLAIVEKEGKYGVVDTMGIYVVYPEYEYNINFSHYPLLCLRKGATTIYRHVKNGNYYKDYSSFWREYYLGNDYVIGKNDSDVESYYSCKTGEFVEESELIEYTKRPGIKTIESIKKDGLVSKEGIYLSFDNQQQKYLLKELATRRSVTQAIYNKPGGKICPTNYGSTPKWENDMIVLREGTEKSFNDVVFDAKGNIIFTTQKNEEIETIKGDYILTSKRKSKDTYTNTIYDKNGNCVKTGRNIETLHDYYTDKLNWWTYYYKYQLKERQLSKNWYVISTYKNKKEQITLFNAMSRQEYPVSSFAISEGWIKYCTDEGYGYINMESEEIIEPQYDYANIFSDSIAIVTKNGRNYVINKKGKIILEENENFRIEASIFSEGVALASKKIKDGSGTTSRYGYIYNPLRNSKFNYAQSKEKIAAQYIKTWMEEAEKLCNKDMPQYAKDYYCYVSICIPDDINILNGYAICLNESGNYDEAISILNKALKIEPDNMTIKKNLDIITKKKQKAGIEYLYAQAKNALERKDYVTAKECFFLIHNADPSDMIALTNYGICLNNTGFYDDAIKIYNTVLEITPTDEFVINARNTSINNKKIIEENQAQTESEENHEDNSISATLNSIATLINDLRGNENVNTYDNGGNIHKQQTNFNNSNLDGSTYLSLYQKWERRAQSSYNSLTNLGYSVRNNNGERSGSTGQSMNSINYTRMKKTLREAQNEMRKIRLKATRAGVNIAQSNWETATVNY